MRPNADGNQLLSWWDLAAEALNSLTSAPTVASTPSPVPKSVFPQGHGVITITPNNYHIRRLETASAAQQYPELNRSSNMFDNKGIVTIHSNSKAPTGINLTESQCEAVIPNTRSRKIRQTLDSGGGTPIDLNINLTLKAYCHHGSDGESECESKCRCKSKCKCKRKCKYTGNRSKPIPEQNTADANVSIEPNELPSIYNNSNYLFCHGFLNI